MNFQKEDLQIIVKQITNGHSMNWLGRSKAKNPGENLDPYLEKVVLKLLGQNLFIDFRKLEFMNSSTVPSIISFAMKLDKNNIKTIFWYDGSADWQVASFTAFSIIVQTMKNVSLEAK